ncbi:MAG TPA: carboxylating nicotinate-nucleotide diphosphorylase [Polyangia bacterium]|nr:carboxylating nicotinate-nucleotide diphosphorylase [Polyangia bacterium]
MNRTDEPLPPSVHALIDLALEEDAGRGDVTTRLCVPAGVHGSGSVSAKGGCVLSGLDVFAAVLERVDGETVCHAVAHDGDQVGAGGLVVEVEGRLSSLLVAERVALNFLQRLSGIATLTRRFVEALPAGSKARIVDTRKTTPGLRWFERRAVRHGGGGNHRADLAGGILIKENHVAAAGSIHVTVAACRAGAPHSLRVQVEVRDLAGLREALAAGADAVLLDNMTAGQVRECVEIAGGRVLVEASGGVELATVPALALAGVDVISVGALTHSAPAADLSFLVRGA